MKSKLLPQKLSFVLVLFLAFLFASLAFIAKVNAQSVYLDLQDRLQVNWQQFSSSNRRFVGIINPLDDDQNTVSYIASIYQNQCQGEASYVLRGLANIATASEISLPVAQNLNPQALCLEVCTIFYSDSQAYPVCNQQLTKDLPNNVVVENNFLTLNLPSVGSIFSGEFNKISWTFKQTPPTNSQLEVAYKLVGSNNDFRALAILPASTTSYFWDVSNVANGQYQIRITIFNASNSSNLINEENTIAEVVSTNFLVDNPSGSQAVSKGVIADLTPASGSSTQNQRPIISGRFILPAAQRVDVSSFKLTVNGFDRSELCRVDNSGFQCQLAPSLPAGLQFVQVSVRTDSQEQLAAGWQFSVEAQTSAGSRFLGINWGSVNWVFIFVLVLVVALIIFLIWYIVNKIRLRQSETVYVSNDYEYEPVNSYSDGDTIVKTTKVGSAPVAESQTIVVAPQETNTQNIYLDPTDYPTYEDYLKAVSSKLAESEKTYVSMTLPESTTTETITEINDADIITVPDYSIEDEPKKDENQGNKDSADNGQNGGQNNSNNAKSGDSTPDWLKS